MGCKGNKCSKGDKGDVLFLDVVGAQAQVLIKINPSASSGKGRWFAYAPSPYRCNGTGQPPKVTCPVVDASAIDEELFPKMAQVIGDCVDVVHGVIDKRGLLTGLEALGASVARVAVQ